MSEEWEDLPAGHMNPGGEMQKMQRALKAGGYELNALSSGALLGWAARLMRKEGQEKFLAIARTVWAFQGSAKP
jgi:hypothetical protein